PRRRPNLAALLAHSDLYAADCCHSPLFSLRTICRAALIIAELHGGSGRGAGRSFVRLSSVARAPDGAALSLAVPAQRVALLAQAELEQRALTDRHPETFAYGKKEVSRQAAHAHGCGHFLAT